MMVDRSTRISGLLKYLGLPEGALEAGSFESLDASVKRTALLKFLDLAEGSMDESAFFDILGAYGLIQDPEKADKKFVYHPVSNPLGEDLEVTWNAKLTDGMDVNRHDPHTLASPIQYFDSFEFIVNHTGGDNFVARLKAIMETGFTREVQVGAKSFVSANGSDYLTHNYGTPNARRVELNLNGPSGFLIDQPDAENLAKALFNREDPLYVNHVVKSLTGRNLDIIRNDGPPWPGERFVTMCYHGDKMRLNTIVSEHTTRAAHVFSSKPVSGSSQQD